jgi:4'-phosphopantetheinyl transferase
VARPEGGDSAALHVLRMDRVYPWETLRTLIDRVPADERRRILRFRRLSDAQRCLVGQLLARELLGLPDGCWPLRRNVYGRPCLDRSVSGLGDFNLSHSGPWVALACTPQGVIGVDVEVERDVSPDLMRLVYTPEEQAPLAGGSGPGFRAAFFRQWTLKESFIKAVGCGLSLPLHAFSVDASEPERILLRWTTGSSTTLRWRFRHSTALGPACHVAVCTEGVEPPRRAALLRLVIERGTPIFVREAAAVDLTT